MAKLNERDISIICDLLGRIASALEEHNIIMLRQQPVNRGDKL